MWLDGEPIDPDATYRVAATSFLVVRAVTTSGASRTATQRAGHRQDRPAGGRRLPGRVRPDGAAAGRLRASTRSASHFPGGAPASYGAGDTLAFTLSSLAMTGLDDVQDSQVEVLLGGTVLGTFPVTNTLRTEPDDEAGTASVSVVLPAGLADGSADVVVRGTATGTEAIVPIATTDGLPDSTVSAAGRLDDVRPDRRGRGDRRPVDGHRHRDGPRRHHRRSARRPCAGGTATVAIPAGSLEVGRARAHRSCTPATAATSPVAGHDDDDGDEGDADAHRHADAGRGADRADLVDRGDRGRTGVDPTGTVTASIGGTVVDSATLAGGAATLTVGPFTTAGDRTVTIAYSGDGRTASGSTTTTVAGDSRGTRSTRTTTSRPLRRWSTAPPARSRSRSRSTEPNVRLAAAARRQHGDRHRHGRRGRHRRR